MAGTLKGVLSQRLIPKVCEECRGSGCSGCAGSGLTGRVLAAEFLRIDGQLTDAISNGAQRPELQRLAKENGFRPMRDLVEMGGNVGADAAHPSMN